MRAGREGKLHQSLPVNHQAVRTSLKPAARWRPQALERTRRNLAAKATSAPPKLQPLQNDRSGVMDDVLSLANIRESLIRQEDTIIFSLIERAQFAVNSAVYTPGGILEYYLRETEQLHGRIRRFTSPDEHPFFPNDVPELVLRPITYASVLAPFNKEINVNARVMQLYTTHLLPGIAAPGDDNNYGSSAMYDALVLQALSKRVHYGKFVAEAKFLAQREEYSDLIRRQDSQAIMDLLTNKAVEKQVIARVRRKTAMFGQDYTPDGPVGEEEGSTRYKVQPDRVAELFRDWVMPLTKDVEVMYLLRRLEWDR